MRLERTTGKNRQFSSFPIPCSCSTLEKKVEGNRQNNHPAGRFPRSFPFSCFVPTGEKPRKLKTSKTRWEKHVEVVNNIISPPINTRWSQKSWEILGKLGNVDVPPKYPESPVEAARSPESRSIPVFPVHPASSLGWQTLRLQTEPSPVW